MLSQHVTQASNNIGEERIRNVRNDDTDSVTLIRLKSTRKTVRPVPKSID